MDNKKNTWRQYFALGEVFTYFLRFFGKNEDKTSNFNIRVMHGINKISILIFLVALIVMIVRFFFRN